VRQQEIRGVVRGGRKPSMDQNQEGKLIWKNVPGRISNLYRGQGVQPFWYCIWFARGKSMSFKRTHP
jgi:hypothetical protein